VHTLDIWDRPFAKESVLELLSLKDSVNELGYKSIIGYWFNPKEIWWHIKYLFKKDLSEIDIKHDFGKQDKKTYSNGKKNIKIGTSLDNIRISTGKKKELLMLENLCKNESLHCLFINGPIHEDVLKNSKYFLKYLKTDIKPSFQAIKYFETTFPYPNDKMGDSLDHIAVEYKNEFTFAYYNLIKKDLIVENKKNNTLEAVSQKHKPIN